MGSIIAPFLIRPLPNPLLEIPMKLLQTLVAVVVLFSGVAYAADEHDQALVERIKAVGQVCQAGGNCDTAAPAAGGGAKAAAARSGADIAAKNCAMCHGTPGIPGAPKTAAEWKPRLAAKGIDGLVASATKGLNAMPPKGMCMDCSPAELKAAIQHLTK